MKLKIFTLSIILASLSFADTTLCYKKGWKKLSEIESIPLDGGLCASKLSLTDMKLRGFNVKDVQVTPTTNGIDYTYILSNDVEKTPSQKALPVYNTEYFKIYDVTEDSAKINRGNLKAGQSGIIIHRYPNTLQSIVATATVSQSNNDYSIIKLEKFEDLRQNAIPTTKLTAADGDVFALNFLYNNSILIAPNADSYKTVTTKFKSNNFIQLDIFGYYLKANNEPLPSRKIIQDFAKQQNLGTLFFAIDNYVYILDAKTFTILDKVFMFDSNTEQNLPFYTRVEEIEDNFWNIDLEKIKKLIDPFDKKDEKIGNSYNDYYKSILGLE